MATASHSFEEHTGEVRLVISAPSLEALFVEAGRGLAELMLGEGALERAEGGVPVRVQVRARDRRALLVDWLNELIFQGEVSKQVFTRFSITGLDETAEGAWLRAELEGLHPETLKTAVKAATLHEVEVGPAPEGWRASVVLDV